MSLYEEFRFKPAPWLPHSELPLEELERVRNIKREDMEYTNENGQMVVPSGAVVVAGSRPISKGPGAEQGVHLYCPVIVKYRDEKTSGSITLEDMLR